MRSSCWLFIVLLSLFSLLGCQQKIDFEKEKAEILKLINDYDDAFLNADVDKLLTYFTDEFYLLDEGKVIKYSLADLRNELETNFEELKVTQWEHLIDPIINLSSDGKTAWIIAQMHRTFTSTDSTALEQNLKYEIAVLQIAVKQNDKWLLSDLAQPSIILK